MTREQIWLQTYLARLQAGASHNDAVYEANFHIDLVMEAYIHQTKVDLNEIRTP